MRTVFITGCATGFGRRLAVSLLQRGDRVIATDPDRASIADLAAERCLCLPLDVRDPDQVERAARRAVAWSPPDVLVNNGGYALFGTQEETGLDAVRDLFEVNVFGVARVTQALLPILRERRGTVVQLSSVAGRTVFPESGWYAATKHAVEALGEALYQECCTFGLKVRLVEPGSFATCFLATAERMSPPRSPRSPYVSLYPLWDERKREALESPQDPELVVQAILASLDDPRPFFRIPVGLDAERMLRLREALGADGWSLLQGARNGGGGSITPEQVLAGDAHAVDVARAAAEAGQLEHWRAHEEGRRALRAIEAKR